MFFSGPPTLTSPQPTTSTFGVVKFLNHTSRKTNPITDLKTHLVVEKTIPKPSTTEPFETDSLLSTLRPFLVVDNATLNASVPRVLTEMPWPVKKEAVVEGDLVLGGLMMVHEREDSITCGPVMPQGGIQALEAMLYTLDRLNYAQDPLLPNVTIGAHILDDCDKDTYGLEMAVDFIKGMWCVVCFILCFVCFIVAILESLMKLKWSKMLCWNKINNNIHCVSLNMLISKKKCYLRQPNFLEMSLKNNFSSKTVKNEEYFKMIHKILNNLIKIKLRK